MKTTNESIKEKSILELLILIFVPTTLTTAVYVILGFMQNSIPSILLFFLCALFILFPLELCVIIRASKKEYGYYSLKSAFSRQEKKSWLTILIYGAVLFAFSGIMLLTIAPLENYLLAPVSNQLSQLIPEYFNWSNLEYIKQYSKDILLLTCIGYFLLNVIVGPIVEELFFRGYLTSKMSRFGNYTPVIITILFSLYHFWLPFNNLFRFSVFFPSAFVAWKKRNIFISMLFHCMCNFFTTVTFIVALYNL